MRIGLTLPQYEIDFARGACDATATIAYARAAEALGFDDVWVSDHPFAIAPDGTASGALEALTLAAAVAASTERIGVGTLVLSTAMRDPDDVAAGARALAAVAPDRITIGLGAGWYEPEHEAFGVRLPPFDERIERLRAALKNLAGVRSLVGGSSAAVRALASEADGWNLAWDPPADEFRARAPAGVARAVGLTILVARDAEAMRDAVDRVRVRAPFLASLSPAALAGTIVCGTPEVCAERIASYGADEVVLAPFVRDDAGMAATIAREVIPRLRAGR